MLASDARTSRTYMKLTVASGGASASHKSRISTAIPSPCLRVADLDTGCGESHGKTPAAPRESSDNGIPLPSPWETEEGEARMRRATLHNPLRPKTSDRAMTMPLTVPVAPLNLHRRPRRKSLSMDAAQRTSLFEVRHAAEILEDSTNTAGPSQLLRAQSLQAQTGGKKRLPRLPRPLPPVPLSRPSTPIASAESSPINGSRPLPLPPAHTDDVEPALQSAPANLVTPSRDQRAETPLLSLPPSPAGTAPSSPDDESLSPLSLLTPEANFPEIDGFAISVRSSSSINTLLSPVSTKKRSRNNGRIHTSPYKCSRGSARFSTTSLSSQVSLPPTPPPAEIRRRNRDKMAKLVRKFGECPPSHLVFGEQDQDAITEEEEVAAPPPAASESSPRPSDASSSATCIPDLIDEKIRSYSGAIHEDALESRFMRKALSDSDAGHSMFNTGKRGPSPTIMQTTRTTRVLHRTKKGRADADKAARYVVSLAGDSTSPAPTRFTFKLTTKVKPCGSYLRSAYGLETTKVEEVPPLPVPIRLSALELLNQQSKTWVHETERNRWEVDDYNNVMESLRKL